MISAKPLEALTNPIYLVLVLVIVIGAAIGAGLVGHFMGLCEVEAAIAAGLCMSNMAQTGDLATLAAADRMGTASIFLFIRPESEVPSCWCWREFC